MDITDNSVTLQNALKEIESLRSRIKQLSTESDRLETGVREAWKERDEWKRRFNILWKWLGWHDPKNNVFVDDFPEAANWYEED